MATEDEAPGSIPPLAPPPPLGPAPPLAPAAASRKPLILIGVGLAAAIGLVLILSFAGVFGRDGTPVSGKEQGSAIAVPDRGTGVASGSWLGGRWCSDVDSITFSPETASWSVSATQYGTYRLNGSQLVLSAPGGESRTVTVVMLDATRMTMSAPDQGSETLRRC